MKIISKIVAEITLLKNYGAKKIKYLKNTK